MCNMNTKVENPQHIESDNLMAKFACQGSEATATNIRSNQGLIELPTVARGHNIITPYIYR